MLIAVRGAPLGFYDEHDYERIAVSLASGRGFAGRFGPTAFRPPGQPAFMALVYLSVGHSPVTVLILQAVLLSLVPFLVAHLARLISGRPAVSNGAAALAALHPALLYASATLYPVALTTALLAITVLTSLEALDRPGLRHPVAAGLSLSALTLTTPYFALLIPIVLALLLLRRRLGALILVAVLALVPLGAWMARNAAVLDTPALTTSNGFNLALGANNRATPRSGNWVQPDPTSVPDGEGARDRVYRQAAFTWIAGHPLRYLALALGRAVCVLDSVGNPVTRGEHDGLLARAAGWALLPVVLLGLLGLWLERRKAASWLVAAALGAVVMASAATLVKPRFRFPCDPLLAPFAALAVERGRRREPSPAGSAAPARLEAQGAGAMEE